MGGHDIGPGLYIPDDLDAWKRWRAHERRVHEAISRLRRHGRPPTRRPAILSLPVDEPNVLVVIDSMTPSHRAAVWESATRLDPRTTAVLSRIPEAAGFVMTAQRRVWRPGLPLPSSIGAVLSLGAFNELAGWVKPWASRHDAEFFVVQHGLLTPWAPPLAPGDHFLAWSEADVAYQVAGRTDVTADVVGSQMLWAAAQEPQAHLVDQRPVMLGQLHGVELPRLGKQRIYTDFCRRHDATYRPHPAETDLLSRAQHQVMARRGVVVDTGAIGIADLGRPIVSVFSTGTLEAAARGLPAWVWHPDPPEWLRELWHRYGMSRYGSAPMAMPQVLGDSPAEFISTLMGSSERSAS